MGVYVEASGQVVLLYAQDDKFSADDATIFEKALGAEGIQITKKVAFSKNDVDFAGTVGQVKGDNPDAIVVGALAGPATKILQEIAKQMPGKKMLCGNGCNTPAIISSSCGRVRSPSSDDSVFHSAKCSAGVVIVPTRALR